MLRLKKSSPFLLEQQQRRHTYIHERSGEALTDQLNCSCQRAMVKSEKIAMCLWCITIDEKRIMHGIDEICTVGDTCQVTYTTILQVSMIQSKVSFVI